jgi:hypothetical protein
MARAPARARAVSSEAVVELPPVESTARMQPRIDVTIRDGAAIVFSDCHFHPNEPPSTAWRAAVTDPTTRSACPVPELRPVPVQTRPSYHHKDVSYWIKSRWLSSSTADPTGRPEGIPRISRHEHRPRHRQHSRCSGLATFANLPQALRNLKIGVLQARRTRRSSRFGENRAPHSDPRGLGIGMACRARSACDRDQPGAAGRGGCGLSAGRGLPGSVPAPRWHFQHWSASSGRWRGPRGAAVALRARTPRGSETGLAGCDRRPAVRAVECQPLLTSTSAHPAQ